MGEPFEISLAVWNANKYNEVRHIHEFMSEIVSSVIVSANQWKALDSPSEEGIRLAEDFYSVLGTSSFQLGIGKEKTHLANSALRFTPEHPESVDGWLSIQGSQKEVWFQSTKTGYSDTESGARHFRPTWLSGPAVLITGKLFPAITQDGECRFTVVVTVTGTDMSYAVSTAQAENTFWVKQEQEPGPSGGGSGTVDNLYRQ